MRSGSAAAASAWSIEIGNISTPLAAVCLVGFPATAEADLILSIGDLVTYGGADSELV